MQQENSLTEDSSVHRALCSMNYYLVEHVCVLHALLSISDGPSDGPAKKQNKI